MITKILQNLATSIRQILPPGLATVALNLGVIHTDILAPCFAESASEYPNPEEWIKTAGPFILKIFLKPEKRHPRPLLSGHGVTPHLVFFGPSVHFTSHEKPIDPHSFHGSSSRRLRGHGWMLEPHPR